MNRSLRTILVLLALAMSVVAPATAVLAAPPSELTAAEIELAARQDKIKAATHIEKVLTPSDKNWGKKNVDSPVTALASDGVNSLSFSNFNYGDMVFLTNPNCVFLDGVVCTWRHMAFFDKYYQSNPSDLTERPFWSAYPNSGVCNTEPDVCSKVGRQSKNSIRSWYDQAQGGAVLSVDLTKRYNGILFARAQAGESYSSPTPKIGDSNWYCSKLPWRSYQSAASIDLDTNGGYWVTPDDIYINPKVSIFVSSL